MKIDRHAPAATLLRRSPRPGAILLAALLACSAAGCAVPVSHSQFSIPAGPGKEGDFASTTDLRIAGLAAEAMNYSKRGRFFEAENRLRQADYLAPGNERVEYSLAVAMNQTGQSEDAKQIVEGLLRRKPNDPNLLAALADIEFSLGAPQEARTRLKASFVQFREAGNAQQASRLARSIANLAFIEGNEQEALCYSHEAWTLGQNSEQLAWHLRLLVALNLFAEAKESAVGAIAKNKALGRSAPVQLALALAKAGLGDFEGASESAEIAVDLIPEAPEMGSEISTVAWLVSKRLDKAPAAPGGEEAEAERVELVLGFRAREPHELITWPPVLREQLAAVQPLE